MKPRHLTIAITADLRDASKLDLLGIATGVQGVSD
jgi:hypothetical protein